MKIKIDGMELAATRRDPVVASGRPLIVTLHGGLYTGRYFDVPLSPGGSFVDVASQLGYPTLTFDRPGYGASAQLPPEENTFERQAALLGAAIRAAAGGSAVLLVGHSIGGMIALTIAAMSDGPALLGVSATGMGAYVPSGGGADELTGEVLASVVHALRADTRAPADVAAEVLRLGERTVGAGSHRNNSSAAPAAHASARSIAAASSARSRNVSCPSGAESTSRRSSRRSCGASRRARAG